MVYVVSEHVSDAQDWLGWRQRFVREEYFSQHVEPFQITLYLVNLEQQKQLGQCLPVTAFMS